MTAPQNQQQQIDQNDIAEYVWEQAQQIMLFKKHIKELNVLLEETKAKLPEANKE